MFETECAGYRLMLEMALRGIFSSLIGPSGEYAADYFRGAIAAFQGRRPISKFFMGCNARAAVRGATFNMGYQRTRARMLATIGLANGTSMGAPAINPNDPAIPGFLNWWGDANRLVLEENYELSLQPASAKTLIPTGDEDMYFG